jgi:hypothetical protein
MMHEQIIVLQDKVSTSSYGDLLSTGTLFSVPCSFTISLMS